MMAVYSVGGRVCVHCVGVVSIERRKQQGNSKGRNVDLEVDTFAARDKDECSVVLFIEERRLSCLFSLNSRNISMEARYDQ